MPLVTTTLNTALASAFEQGMLVYQTTIAASPGIDVGAAARVAAAAAFSNIATPAIDLYIKSATIIVPPGQVIVGAGGGPAPVSGATSAPSPPAIIT